MISKSTKFLALFDLHFGYEWGWKAGVRKILPAFAKDAIQAVMDFAKDFRPTAVILGGDQLNFGPISHWNRGLPRITEGLRLKEEMDELDEVVLKPLDKIVGKGLKYWMDGNHEVWMRRFVDENPGLEGLVEPSAYLRLKQRGWQLFSQGEVSRLGKLYFVHGDVLFGRRSYSTVNPARLLVNTFHRNIRAGHLHTYSVATEISPADRYDYHTGIVVPSLSSRTPYYVHYNPTNHMHGFLCGVVYPDGFFTDQVVVVNRGSFYSMEGKKYG